MKLQEYIILELFVYMKILIYQKNGLAKIGSLDNAIVVQEAKF